MSDLPADLGQLIRREQPQVLATLVRLTGSIDRAEDAVADATIEALRTWPEAGIPTRPGAWLTTVARRKALDALRREAGRASREAAATSLWDGDDVLPDVHTVRDDQLRLIFTCCHPALGTEAQVALALRLLCGLTTREIAAAFVETEVATGKRITRAKAKLADNRIGYRVPSDAELPDRLAGVLAVVAIIFTTGHHAPSGATLVRADLTAEALRLAELLVDLMPDEPECLGLLALLTATEARSPGRVDDGGDVVLLGDADRATWDRAAIDRAVQLTHRAMRHGRPGPYQLQAAISCLHGVAPDLARTDWPQVVALYDVLLRLAPSPIVRVNRAVAIAERDGAAAGLVELEAIAGELDGWHAFHVARAELRRRVGDHPGAAEAYRDALATATNVPERRHLERRLAELDLST